MRSPVNGQELYNLRHAQVRNVVERIFGVVKRHFAILVVPPHFSMDIQIRIPPGLAAVHNMIVQLDPVAVEDMNAELDEENGPADPSRGVPQYEDAYLASGPITTAEERRAAASRDEIARRMWEDYQRIVQARQLV